MEWLKPDKEDLKFYWQYFFRLPDWIQLAEDTSPVRELAKRVNKLRRRRQQPWSRQPCPLAAEIVTVAQTWPGKKQWHKQKPDDLKHWHSEDGGQGGAKRKPDPWVSMGICKIHYSYGDGATSCFEHCLRGVWGCPSLEAPPSHETVPLPWQPIFSFFIKLNYCHDPNCNYMALLCPTIYPSYSPHFSNMFDMYSIHSRIRTVMTLCPAAP